MEKSAGIAILLNGTPARLQGETNIKELLDKEGYTDKLVAVAINNTFVPKSSYAKHILNEGDKIEIVAPMQGG